MSVRTDLEAARELIRDPNKWCQRRMHTEDGRRCALAAVEDAVLGGSTVPCDAPVVTALYRVVGCEGMLGHFNDTHTHAEVLELFNLAIADEIAKEEAHTRHMQEEAEREIVEDPAAPLVFA